MSLREELESICIELEELYPELVDKQKKFLDLTVRQAEIRMQMKQLLSPEGR